MELSELLEQLDLSKDLLEEGKTVEDFSAAFNTKFLARDVAHTDPKIKSKIAGEVLGAATVKLQQISGLTVGDTKGKKLEEVIDLVAEKFTSQITTLTETAGKNNDEKLTLLTEEVEKAKKDAKKWKDLSDNNATALDTTNKDWEGKFKGYKTDSKFKEIKSKVPFKDDIKEVEQIGFEALLKAKYKFDLDESGEDLVAFDIKTNEPIKNSKGTGFLKAHEVVELEAVAQGLRKMNNADASKGAPKPSFTHQHNNNNGQNDQQTNGRKVSASAIQHAQVTK